MDNQKIFSSLFVRRLPLLLITVLFAGLALAIILVPIAWADTAIFVRPGGDDILCNGTANLDYDPDVAPNCAVKTMQKGLSLAGSIGAVNFTAGSFSTTIPVNNDVGIAATSLSISKSDSPDPVDVGDPLTYTVIVTNTGGSSATNVILLDFLPSLGIVTYVDGSATASQGSCGLLPPTLNVISCTLGVLNPGITATVTIPVTPTAAGTVVNEAQVLSSDANTVDFKETTTFSGTTNLSASKSDSPDPVPVGAPLTYTITVTNGGSDAAAVVTLTDTLPGSTGFVSATPSQGGPCSEMSGIVTCPLGLLGSNLSATVTVVVTPTVDGVITNTVSVTDGGFDIDPGNNVATETTTVTPAADLAISKSDSPDPVAPGGTLTYTLTIINNGLSDAQNVVVTDTLPLSVSVTGVAPPTSTQNGQQLGWNLGQLNNGVSQTITVVLTVDSNANGVIINTAEVTSSTPDLISGNNVVTASTTIITGSSAVYLPIILKEFQGASAFLEWDGLEPVRDRVSDLDGGAGLVADGNNDGVFKLSVNIGSEGPKNVSDVRLASTQGVEWDTLAGNGKPVLGIFNGGSVLNNPADGTVSGVLFNAGLVIVRLYASDDTSATPAPRFPPETYTYTVTINFTDGTSLVADATIPPAAPALPPTSLSHVSDVAADPDTNQIFVASPRHNWVYIIDGSNDTVTRTVPVGNGPTGLTVLDATVAANNKVFVTHQYGANFWRPGIKAFGVNETTSHDTFDTGYAGAAPIKIAANGANNSRVYVSNYFDKLAVLDGASGPPENRLGWVVQKAYQAAYGIDTSSTTNRVYLASRDTGELVVFDGNSDRLLQSGYIPTHVKPPQPCSLWSVAVSETTGHVFVPCPQLSKVFVLEESQVSVLGLEALGVLENRSGSLALVVSPAVAPWIAEIDISGGTGLGEEGIAVDTSTSTGHVFITNASNDTLVILQDGGTPSYVTTIAVGDQPQGVDVNSATQKVYVGNAGSNSITVLNATPPFSVTATIPLTP